MWQQGKSMGIVAYDRLVRGEIYFVQPDAKVQLSRLDSWRFLSLEERSANIWIYIALELTYYNHYDAVNALNAQ